MHNLLKKSKLKNSKLQSLKLSAIALSLAALPLALPVSAQTNVAPGNGGTTTDTQTYTNRGGFDWGWLGLLGLIGLAGLSRKSDDSTRYRDPDSTTRTGIR